MNIIFGRKKTNLKKGQVMLVTAIVFMMLSLIIMFGIAGPIIKEEKNTLDLWKSKESYYLSEAGTEDVVYRVKNNMTVANTESLTINNFSTVTSIADTSDGKTITSQSNRSGYVKKIETKVKESAGVSFSYGLQTGTGGFLFTNSGGVIGNVFSNGNIVSTNSSAYITGAAIVANGASMFPDQTNDAPTSSPNSIIFGNSNSTQDLAQSFSVSSTSPLTQISLYLKKIGSPANITLKIIKDYLGSPSSSSGDVLSSATLSAALLTTSYGWVDVSLSTNPSLTPGTTYWLVLDTSTNSSNYYNIGANLDNSYLSGTSKIGAIGSSWTNTGYDSYFRIYLGGFFGQIVGVNQYNRFSISGGAYAHAVSSVNSGGFLRCQVGGSVGYTNNKACDTSYPDPAPSSYPVSDGNIADWKAAALLGGSTGTFNAGTWQTWTLGPKKINGDLLISGSAKVIVTGTLWVTGNVIMDGNSRLVLSSSYGSGSGIIVTDGKIVIPGSCQASGSGQTGSYMMLVTTSDCPASSSCGGANAVEMSGSGGAVIINAQKGTANFGGSATANEVTANKVIISGGGAVITYSTGLANPNFVTGPSGSFGITEWKELQQ
jgi:hypothetical protein